ncbi:MAG: ATP12 family chaperone protein, partial [Hyphomicrobiaceae bacterium]
MSDTGDRKAPAQPGKEPEGRPLPKRFYTRATTGPADQGFTILLDQRPVRTPRRAPLVVATQPLAEAIAAEWQAQGEHVDPTGMPLTRLANTALDGVTGREADVKADIVKYAGSDLLCYRADYPDGLVQRQADLWDPVLAWYVATHGAPFTVATGLMPVAQTPAALAAIDALLADADPFKLAATHIMTTLMGSALLALAVSEGHLTAEAAWEAAHVDEDWQISEW